MASGTVTLYIDDTSIRLVVMSGKRVKKWAEQPLEPGMVKNAVVIKEAEVTAKIKQLLQAWNIKTKKVIVGMSGLHCLSRPMYLPLLPANMLDEAVKREARRVLPVPLEQLYLSWQTVSATPTKIGVFLVAVPCRTADSLLKTLAQAGLKPDFMDLKPLAIARASREPTSIIVDVQPAEFDIVVMAGGIPQPIRTISLPEEELSWEEKASLIKDDLERTITFYNTNNPEMPLVPSVPVYISGDMAKQTALCEQLANTLGHPVLPFPSPLPKTPWGFDPSHYRVNIGLTLKKVALRKEPSALAPNLNILPLPYRPKSVSLGRLLALPGAVVVIGALVPLVMLIQNASADIDTLRAQVDTNTKLLQQRLTQKQQLTGKVAELEKKATAASKTDDKLTLVLNNIKTQVSGVNGDLDIMTRNLPNTITPTRIEHNNGVLTITGRAPGEQDILAYLRSLDQSRRFGVINVTLITETVSEAQTEQPEEQPVPPPEGGQSEPPAQDGQQEQPAQDTPLARDFIITLKSGGNS